MHSLSRRDFLRFSAAAAGTVIVSSGLSGCSEDTTVSGVAASFDHGVASGDPGLDRAIIWTRATPESDGTVNIQWEVATDAAFTNLTHDGATSTDVSRDYTVKVDVQNLAAGTTYYYRFTAPNQVSSIGKFKTLPASDVDSVAFAVVSCSNYPFGRFHVYRDVANRNDIDAVLHLGDYIYEYAAGTYPAETDIAAGRELTDDNTGETISLENYRNRYALYRSDTDLQAAHASAAFITIWDDHEVANDTYQTGAENHDTATEGDFGVRRADAMQAWFEWTPVRPASVGDESTIYRRFDFGTLVSLYMLDTRQIGRDVQLALADFIDPTTGAVDGANFAAALADTSRSILGADQLNWLQTAMANSTALWQVLGQQVLMGRMNVPVELLTTTPPNPAALGELVTTKSRLLQGDTSVSAEDRARVETVIPYNLDAWDGYAVERETILETALSMDKNLIVLAGDTHNAWANNLKTLNGTPVGVEFATASVTSPGLETFFGITNTASAIQVEFALTTLIDDLSYLNVADRGYLVARFTREAASAEWIHIDSVKNSNYTVVSERSKTLTTLPGDSGRSLLNG